MSNIDWPGLLKWSTNHHDGTSDPKQFKPLSDEDKAFLQGALAQAFEGVEDANELMREALEKIKNAGDDADVTNTALEVVDKCCDFPDVPKNLAKLDGVPVMLKLLEHADVNCACKGAALFTIMLCSNSEVQKATAREGGLEALYKFADRGEEPFFRGLSCIAALVRHEPELERKLVTGNGNALLIKALSPERSARVRTKGASLLRHLLVEKQYDAEHFQDAETLNRFAQCVAEILSLDVHHMQYGETVAALTSALHAAIEDHRARSRCSEEGLKSLVTAAHARIATLRALDEDRSAEIDLLEDCDKQRRTSRPEHREEVKMLKG